MASMMSGDGAATASSSWLIFSYGSNSTKQLQKRVENLSLTSAAAVAHDFSRCFCRQSQRWGAGGIATLAPEAGAKTFGSVVRLSEAEKVRLDVFEFGPPGTANPPYRLEPLLVTIRGDTQPQPAFAYIANSTPPGDAAFTAAMTVPPHEQYLVAIHAMLREHYDMEGETITVRSFAPPLAVVSEWTHPGARRLESLGSVVVEVNMRREVPWVMPQTIAEVTAKLGRIGVSTVPQLIAALAPPAGGPGGINSRLCSLDPPERQFSMETIGILRGLLLL